MDKAYYTEGVAEYILTVFPPNYKGICVDVGAYHATWLSSSYLLEQLGWTTYCIEPNPNCLEQLKGREHVFNLAVGPTNMENVPLYVYQGGHGTNGQAGWTGLVEHKELSGILEEVPIVSMMTLDSFLEENNIPNVDFLALDTEGTELDILKGIDLHRWNVNALAVEVTDPNRSPEAYLAERGYIKLPQEFVYNHIYKRNY